MTIFPLDTTTLSLLQRDDPIVLGHLASHTGVSVGTTTVNVEEVMGGWYTRIRKAKSNADLALASYLLADSMKVLARFVIFPLSVSALDRYDGLLRQKLNVGGNDLRIAAISLELGATVVTNNLRDFGRVPGVACEDWSV